MLPDRGMPPQIEQYSGTFTDRMFRQEMGFYKNNARNLRRASLEE